VWYGWQAARARWHSATKVCGATCKLSSMLSAHTGDHTPVHANNHTAKATEEQALPGPPVSYHGVSCAWLPSAQSCLMPQTTGQLLTGRRP
jgi:hypothetical protein